MRCAGPALNRAAGKDEVFRDLVLARIIEPTSKVDSLRVLAETAVESVCYRTVERRLPSYATPGWRNAVGGMRGSRRLGLASLVLYDVTTLHFETDAGDGFREPGFSKERRLDPRSLSACSPMRPGSRHGWRRLRETRPRPPPCCQ